MIIRNLESELKESISDKRSVFLLGPRQTGKTTLLNEISKQFGKVVEYSFLKVSLRQKIEQNPEVMRQEIESSNPDLVIVDEVQKVPKILDEVQYMIDRGRSVFSITGSSSRKLKRKGSNLLAGRAITYRLDPLDISERRSVASDFSTLKTLKRVLTYGDLPEISLLIEQNKTRTVENLLRSYVETFLEEEIRMETLIRKIGMFGNFLKLAAEMSGKLISFRALSQDVGVVHKTIASFFDILHDCLIVEQIPPLLPKSSRRRLSKSSKFIFFDLGVRNATAGLLFDRGITNDEWGNRFEQWVGLSLLRYLRSRNLPGKIYYWRDHNGPEVDWVIEHDNCWIPIEVKFTENILEKHYRYLNQFLEEYNHKASRGYVLFTGERSRQLTKRITALPWSELTQIFTL